MAQPLKNYIRLARKRAGLSQEELAYLLGGRGAKLVSRYERFERVPRLDAALAFEAALGRPVSELFEGHAKRAIERVRRRARVMDLQLRKRGMLTSARRKHENVQRILERPKARDHISS